MDVNEVIRISVTITSVSPLDPGLRIEAWDRDIVFHDLLAEGRIDRQGRCELVFDGDRHRELFLDRRPDVFFRLFVGQRLLLDTRDSVICNLRPGLHEVVLRLPAGEPEQPEQPEQPGGEPTAVIRGRAVLSPAGARGLVITAYADAALKQRLGAAQVDPCGRFAIAVCAPAPRVWLGWEQGDHEGRSPLLQPLAADAPARLHVYRRSRGPAGGRGRFLASVRSASGRAAVSVPVALLEVSLQRCQLLGEALTDETGAARIRYDEAALYSDMPDLRVVVFDRRGTPLLESDGAAVVLPGAHARTQTRFARVAEVLRAEGLARGCELRPEDASYLAGRSGLPALDVAAHAAATALAPALEVPAEALFALASSAAPEPAAALEEAVAGDVASPELLERAAELVPRLAAAGSAWAAREDLGRGSLDDFLATQVADPSARARVAGIILERGGLGAVVETLREEALATPEVRFLVDLQALAGVDVGLARALGRRQENGLPTGEDLALLGPGDWEHVLREAGGGADDPAALRRHAVTLARRTQRMFPDKVFRAQVERPADRAWAQQIGQYLEAHPGWRFRSTPPLEGEDGQGDAETTGLAALVAYQRIVRLTRDHRVVGALLDAGFTTAAELAAVGLPELVGRFANDFEGDVLLLREVHERARSTTAALNAASSFLPSAGGRRCATAPTAAASSARPRTCSSCSRPFAGTGCSATWKHVAPTSPAPTSAAPTRPSRCRRSIS